MERRGRASFSSEEEKNVMRADREGGAVLRFEIPRKGELPRVSLFFAPRQQTKKIGHKLLPGMQAWCVIALKGRGGDETLKEGV